ncbi:MAG: hypothetical protein V4772_28720 [Pseudomonadota bacterium]
MNLLLLKSLAKDQQLRRLRSTTDTETRRKKARLKNFAALLQNTF